MRTRRRAGDRREWCLHYAIALSLYSIPLRRRRRRIVFHEQGNAGLGLVIERNINRVQARFLESQLLKVKKEIACAEVNVVRQRQVHGDGREIGHDGAAVGVHKSQLEVVLPLIAVEERDAQGDRALRVHRGQLLGLNRVEGAEQIQLAVVIRRGVTEDCNLNIHWNAIKTRISRIDTKFFSQLTARASRNVFNSAAALPPKPGTSAIFSTLARRSRWTDPNFFSSAALRRSPMLGNSSRMLSEIFRNRNE